MHRLRKVGRAALAVVIAGASVFVSAGAYSAPAAFAATAPAATAPAATAPFGDSGDGWLPTVDKQYQWRLAATVSTYRLGLSDGQAFDFRSDEDLHTTTTILDQNIGSRSKQFEPSDLAEVPPRTLAWRAEGSDSGAQPVSALLYRIWDRGTETDYWVKMILNGENGLEAYPKGVWCEIYETRPRSHWNDAPPVENGRYRCDTSIVFDDDEHIYFVNYHVTVNRTAEASGTLRTSGPLRLNDGKYAFNNVPLSSAGRGQIAPRGSDSFDTVLTPVDSPTQPNLAKGEFTYRISDDTGELPDAWVVGYSQNGTGGANRGESGCFIADVDPTKTGKPWQEAHRPDNRKYSCAIDYTGPVNNDRDHYSATFTISERPTWGG